MQVDGWMAAGGGATRRAIYVNGARVRVRVDTGWCLTAGRGIERHGSIEGSRVTSAIYVWCSLVVIAGREGRMYRP